MQLAQPVTFPTTSPVTFRDAARGGGARRLEGRGELYLPDGGGEPGSLPAVVVVEGLGGPMDGRERRYGRFLAGHGHAALVIDAFGTRGMGWLPDDARALLVTESMMVADAFAALRFLRGHPLVDPRRVAVLGFSYGGMVAVLAAFRQIRDLFDADGSGFAGHAAFYGCSVMRLADPAAAGGPVLMVLGEQDRNVSIPRSRLIADDLRAGGAEVELAVLPGVFHQWDGEDVERRHVRFNLRQCRATLRRDVRTVEERFGLPVDGRVSRTVAMLAGVSAAGYEIQRDEAALAQTDGMLLDFLGRTVGTAAAGDG